MPRKTSKVTRVAKAIYQEACSFVDVPVPWSLLTPERRKPAIAMAKAAIKEIERETADRNGVTGAKGPLLWRRLQGSSRPRKM